MTWPPSRLSRRRGRRRLRRHPPSAAPVAKTRLGILVLPALIFFLAFAFIPMIGVLLLSFTSWDGISPITFTGFDQLGPGVHRPRHLPRPVADHRRDDHHLGGPDPDQPAARRLRRRPPALPGSSWRCCTSCRCCCPRPRWRSRSSRCSTRTSVWPPGCTCRSSPRTGSGNPTLAFATVVIFVIAWQFIPFHTLIYQGGVRQIPGSIYEAAQIDGAGRVRQFFSITIPQLKYTIITSSTLMLVGSLTYFDLIFVLTGGGPGDATRILALDMYITGFQANQMGAASVIGVDPGRLRAAD